MMIRSITVTVLSLACLMALSVTAFGQAEQPPPGWKTCPHCLTAAQQKNEAKYNSVGMPFNPRDLSGVWNSRPPGVGDFEANGNIIETFADIFDKQLPRNKIPPKNTPTLTPYGQQLFNATKTEGKAPEGTAVTNTKDGMLKCDPLGWPRWLHYNYGLEFVMLPDRVLQFIEWGHTWRTIWTDGRKLPDNPPEPRWLGWTVGHWEDDNTFVVESKGYDDRSWIAEAGNYVTQPGATGWGNYAWPHSDEMRIVERWKRTSFGILETQVTIIDPKVYTKPWTTEVFKHTLLPDTELWEYFCVPTDNDYFNQTHIAPGNQIPVEVIK
jgi:hypothetical protein